MAELADESVCPTLNRNGLRLRGVGAFACQPIFSDREEVAAGLFFTASESEGVSVLHGFFNKILERERGLSAEPCARICL